MSSFRIRSCFTRRNIPKVLLVAAVFYLLTAYYRCSPYICPPRKPVRSNAGDGYPSGSNKSKADGDDQRTPVQTQHYGTRSKALVVSAMKDDDTSWLGHHLPDWDLNIYVMNDPKAKLTVAKNKGRESMAYLTYIIDNYDNLPDYMVFLHSLRYQWHNEDPMYDGVPMIRSLQLPYVQRHGYANMRCTWVIGCPHEIQPAKALSQLEAVFEPKNDRANTEAAYAHAFEELFPGKPIPEEVGIQCGAQFALAKWKVRQRPKRDYQRYRDWLWKTSLPDNVSGRILEYAWHSKLDFSFLQ
ncbi:MAG: hypothetical protein M1831_003057 [Alyxoria varia]|nr:MAG: hypothetical protein M1831_003057 [Alyxoria varia]